MVLTESVVESAALSWLASLGYTVIPGPDPPQTEREHYEEVLLRYHISTALVKLNRAIPDEALKDALLKLIRPESPTLAANNRAFHRMLTDGVPVEYRRKDDSIAGDRVQLIDFEKPENNDFLAVNQFTVEGFDLV